MLAGGGEQTAFRPRLAAKRFPRQGKRKKDFTVFLFSSKVRHVYKEVATDRQVGDRHGHDICTYSVFFVLCKTPTRRSRGMRRANNAGHAKVVVVFTFKNHSDLYSISRASRCPYQYDFYNNALLENTNIVPLGRLGKSGKRRERREREGNL